MDGLRPLSASIIFIFVIIFPGVAEKGDLIQEEGDESSQSVGREGSFDSSHAIFLNKPFKKFVEIRIYSYKSASSPAPVYRVKRK